MALLVGVFLCVVGLALGFNVDIPSRVVYTGNPKSMFGFSVQSHIDGDRKMILVGAPEDEPYAVQGVTKPGAVYRCEPGYAGCSVLVFDKNGANHVDNMNRPIDQKSNQWFGATLSSTGRNGPIVACAPRYVSFVTAKLNQRDPVGSCYVATSSDATTVTEVSPCRTSSHGARKTGVCQAGFSAAVSKDGQRLFMGAPGSFYWQGQTYSIDPSQEFLFFMPKIKDQEGQLYDYTLGGAKPKILSTPEASPKYDDSYMGYSVTVGDFAGQGIQGVAVGVPRASDLKGLVVVYTWELQIVTNISGSQIGSYFGYSLASGDIDGDGFDDIIVGAPMYTKTKAGGYEHGRVYVIYQGRDRTFRRNHFRTGEVSRGRFGLAVTSLGDINYDGFGDIAVGAPYGGENGRGVVYIYHGSEHGIREKYSQAITAEEIQRDLTTFGFSLSGGVDLDNNNYTDLAVGAYKSDAVVFLKSRPVVKVMAGVKFMGEKLISMTDKRCSLQNGTRVACATLMYCLKYDGVNVDQQIDFEVVLDLDSRLKTTKRLFVLESRQTTYTAHILLTQGEQVCREIMVYLDGEIRDKLTPIEVKMTYNLITENVGHIVPPVLDQTETIEHIDSLHIQKNCGPDNICIPDLKLTASTPTVNYILGSGDDINVDVEVENLGEDAFEAAYYLQIPPGVNYAKMVKLDAEDKNAALVYCSTSHVNNNVTLKCELGNPMHSRQKTHFRVVLEVDSQVTNLNFHMVVNSTNPEQGTEGNNERHMSIGVVVKAHLSVIGLSDPPELHYNASQFEQSELTEESARVDTKLGPQLVHKYNIKNEGPFTVEEAEIYLMWPYQTLTGENLMYMLVQPQWVGNMKCDVAHNINPDNLEVQNLYAYMLSKERDEMASTKLYTKEQLSGGSGYYGQSNWEATVSGSTYTDRSQTWQNNQGGYSGQTAQTSQAGQTGQTWQTNRGIQSGQTWQTNQGRQTGQTWQTNQGNEGAQTWQTNQGGQGGQTHQTNQGSQSGQTWQSNQGGQGGQTWQANQGGQSTHTAQGGQNWQGGGQGGTSYSYNRTWSSGQDLSEEEKEIIRRNLELAARGNVYGTGQGQGGIIKVKNRTIIYDQNHNIVSQSESSTEYGNLGHEGEQGSSFNAYGGSQFTRTQNSQGAFVNQGGSQGSNSQSGYSQGGSGQTGYQGGYQQSGQGGYQSGQGGYQQGGQGQGFVHGSWSTTENVNSDVMNARSSTFGGPGVVVVGDDEEDLGGIGAFAARGSNNEFKFGIAEVSEGGNSGAAVGAGSQHGSGYQSGGSFHSGGGYQTGSGYQSGSSHSSSSSSYSSGGGSSYSSSSQSRRESTRRRRDTQVDPQLKEILEKCAEKYKCEVVRCTTGRLTKGQEVWVALRSRINASVLSEISKQQNVILSTLATTRVTRLPMVGTPKETTWHTAEAQTVITRRDAIESVIPAWVIILAAVIGALLLLLLILLLYKCGFFKRNRPSDHAERQPLNGRDEHL